MPKLNLDVTGEENTHDIKIAIDGTVDRANLSSQIQELDVVTDMSQDVKKVYQETAFMEEPITILIHESTNPNDEEYVFCAVNGEGALLGNPWLKRGMEHVVKRKYVLNLITAKTVSYHQPYKDQPGNQANTMRRHSAMKYPFSVISDQNPRGSSWLKEMMAGA